MVAGLNMRVSVWRMNQQSDNIVGGSVLSGTLQYQDVLFRLDPVATEQVLFQQGLQTDRTFTGICVPGTLDIRERDEIEVTYPYDHEYRNVRFRIVEKRTASHNPRDPRNYKIFTLVRSVRAHGEQ